jgi:hypothetical protein
MNQGSDPETGGPATWLWVVLIGTASVALSRVFACAMPFAALAMLAPFTLRGREALAWCCSSGWQTRPSASACCTIRGQHRPSAGA